LLNILPSVNKSAIDDWMAIFQTMRAIQGARAGTQWLSIDLTMAQLKVVMVLVQSGGLPSRAISERLAIGPSAVTPLVDRLVSLDLARRESDPDDRRVIHVRPTAKAIAFKESLLESGRAVLADVLKQVPPSERDNVSRALSVLRESAMRVQARIHARKD
jgi:DNA-binding MarR family transcriptional regulator